MADRIDVGSDVPGPVLLRGGVVHSPADPFATAMVVADGRVAWVGAEGAADTAAGPGVRTVRLDGRLVTPAFVDAHVHVTDTGLALSGLDVSGARSAQQLLDLIAAAAAARPGLPVLGHGWDDTGWPEGAPPRAGVDRAAGAVPVYLSRVDRHSALVSSALLDLQPAIASSDGFDADGPVRREAHHQARRASRDTLTAGQRQTLQERALRAAAAVGIGQVHEMAGPHVAGADDLTLLLRWTADADDVAEVVPYWGELGAVDTARRLGARGCPGTLCPSEDEAVEHLVACTTAGVQGGLHCVDDRAVDVAVRALQRAADRLGPAAVVAARHRLEHVEMVDEDQMAVLARLGVVASVQPAERLNPFAGLARAGVTLAFGSDSPVTPFDPWGGVRAATLHRTAEHRMTARAAFTAHTRGGWRAARVDDAGVLVPGAPATFAVWDVPGDLVVQTPDERVAAWSTDPRAGVPGLPDLSADAPVPTCRLTVVAGRTVFRDP